ncbi:CPLN1 protein, partial [Atrichornis clamosus]|nr:CPLN1 protein [Atrichornis clamosus]
SHLDTMKEASATSADLHYLASVGKKPAETQDASTNTTPVLKSYQDLGISGGNEVSKVQKSLELVTSVPVSESSSSSAILPPDMYVNLNFPTEVNEKPLPSFLSDAPDLHKHDYISVIDIEDCDILNKLPMIPESAEEIAAQPNEKFEIPSTAKLHQTAASVTNAIPPEALQKQG